MRTLLLTVGTLLVAGGLEALLSTGLAIAALIIGGAIVLGVGLHDYRHRLASARPPWVIVRRSEWLRLKRDYQQAMVARLQAEGRVLELEMAKLGPDPDPEPLPQPGDKLLILYRRSLLPAYEALEKLLDDAIRQCFAVGGFRGLSAHFLKYYVMEKAYALRERVTLSASGASETPLVDELRELLHLYDKLASYAWNLGHLEDNEGEERGIPLNAKLLADWFARDAAYDDKYRDQLATEDEEVASLPALLMTGQERLRWLHGRISQQ